MIKSQFNLLYSFMNLFNLLPYAILESKLLVKHYQRPLLPKHAKTEQNRYRGVQMHPCTYSHVEIW